MRRAVIDAELPHVLRVVLVPQPLPGRSEVVGAVHASRAGVLEHVRLAAEATDAGRRVHGVAAARLQAQAVDVLDVPNALDPPCPTRVAASDDPSDLYADEDLRGVRDDDAADPGAAAAGVLEDLHRGVVVRDVPAFGALELDDVEEHVPAPSGVLADKELRGARAREKP